MYFIYLNVTTLPILKFIHEKGKRRNTQERVDINLRYRRLKKGGSCV